MPELPVMAGIRTVRIPDGPSGRDRPVRRRRDRPVAEPRPEAHLRRAADGRRRGRCGPTRSSPPGTEVQLDVPRARAARPRPGARHPAAVVYEDDDLLIVDKPAGLVVHPSPGHHDGDTLVNALLARAGGAEYGGHRRGRAAGHRPSARPRHERAAHGRQARCRPGLADGPAQGPPGQEDLPGARARAAWAPRSAGSRRRSGAIRSTAPGWPSCPTAGHPRPATASASGSPAGRCSSSIS